MPIYYQKIPQNEENESMNYINGGHLPKANFLRQSRANSYYELSEFDSSSSILSIDQIYLEENVQLERIETRYGSVVVGKQVYSNGRPSANGSSQNASVTSNVNASMNASMNASNGTSTAVNGNAATNGNIPANSTTTSTANNSTTNGIRNGATHSAVNSPPANGQSGLLLETNGVRKSNETKSNEIKSGESNETAASRKEARRVSLNSIILTVHDIGLNHESNFLQFFNNFNAKILLKNFTVYHLNLPGQHTSSEQISSIAAYPTMDQMSEIIDFVVGYYDIDNFIGFGTGAGANLLIRFAIKKPAKVNGLFLINPTYSQASWVEWIYQKRNIKHLQADRNSEKHPDRMLLLSPIVQDYLIWHQFGKTSPERETDSLRIIEEYRSYFKSRFIDSINLSLFIDSYVKRKFINLSRDGLKGTNKLQCECTILAGSLSSMRNEANQLYLRLSPDKANWIKFSNCGNPLLEKPVKVLEIFKLMLLGLGYTIKQPRQQIAIRNAMKKSASVGLVLNEPTNSCLIDFFTPN